VSILKLMDMCINPYKPIKVNKINKDPVINTGPDTGLRERIVS